MRILVTGTAGFIGNHLALKLLDRGDQVIGVDNMNDYYDVSLKEARLQRLTSYGSYQHECADLADRQAVDRIFARHQPQRVVNLAAQAGVRYAAQNPHVYINSNVTGFLHILEGCRFNSVEHLVYASTSSVYGANTKMPFSELHSVNHPLTLYAATKMANETMAHSYSHLYGLPTTGLRFFTVYGPWGRPDMALFRFTKAILAGESIQVFNRGNHRRSFTYIDDIVEGIIRSLDKIATSDATWKSGDPLPATSGVAPYRIFNIGNAEPVNLLDYVKVLERHLGVKAQIDFLPLQDGDVPHTEADTSLLAEWINYSPSVSVEKGIEMFVHWYRNYYAI